MDTLTVDVIVDATPDEVIERAYHYGIPPGLLDEGIAEPEPTVLPSGMLTIPESWLVAA